MALMNVVSIFFAAAVEAASLIWMELAMFGVAALVYILSFRGSTLSAAGGASIIKKAEQVCAFESSKDQPMETLDDHKVVFKSWLELKNQSYASTVNLASVVHSMQKLGHKRDEIIAELRSALANCPALLPNVMALPAALLRDDAIELLNGVAKMLEEHDANVDLTIYTGIMNGQLRRRDYSGLTDVAARVGAEALTPKMRSMLATAATSRGRLDEALGHLRQMPVTLDGCRCAFSTAGVAQLLALAAKEQRVESVVPELQRLRATLETKQFDDLIVAESKRSKGRGACQDLIEAGVALQVPKGSGTYQALASVFAASGSSIRFRGLLEDLDTEVAKGPSGFAVSEPLALALMDAAKALRDGKLVSRIMHLHRHACAGACSGRVLSCACATLVACDRFDAACEFYETEMVPKGLWPDASLTNSLLKSAAQAGRATLAERLATHAGKMKIAAPGKTSSAKDEMSRHSSMIKAYARDGNLDKAKKAFNRLRSTGGQPSSLIYNGYLDACVQCGDLTEALCIFKKMKDLNIIDVVGYNILLKAYLTKGFTEEAQTLAKEMAVAGFQPNKVTYNELLHAKVIAKDRLGLWRLVEEMQQAGVRANSVTCSILLKSLTQHSISEDVERVVRLIDSVEESIDEVLFSSVIEACIRIQRLDLLSDLMRRYRKKGGFVNLTAPTYGSMIKAYGQKGDVARVRELWQEMAEYGVKPTSITMGCMIEALVVNSQADEALELIHSGAGSNAVINTVIYSTVLKGFAVMRRIDKVFEVFDEMRSKSIPCNTITYNTMLDACAKCCAMDRASGLLVAMRESCVEPDIVTYSTIVKGYCSEGDVDRAFSVLEDMKSDDKLAPDEIMYNSILDGCAKQHRIDDALKVLEEMRSTGIIPSNYTLSILVKVLGHARRLNQACRLVEELSTQHGFRPNVQVYTCLVQACVFNRRLEKALELHDKMVADVGCRVDEKFYAVLARGCLQLHQPSKAADVVRAAYQIPGHSLAEPSRRRAYPVGIDARALEEVANRLQAGSAEEQDIFSKLSADLWEHRSLRMSHCQGGSAGRHYGGAANDVPRRRAPRGGTHRTSK